MGDLFDWAAERDAAMERVAANAEDACPGFALRARAFVLRWLREHGPTAGEAITRACVAAGIEPHDHRAFGPVLAGLSREGKIRRVGTCLRERGHGCSGGNVWALGDKAADNRGERCL